MATSKPHPESLDEVKSLKITDEIREFTNELSKDIEHEENNRKGWEHNIERLDRLRFGMRKNKTHPWPGAANFVLPIIDSDINKLKPNYVNLVYGVNPVVTFEPYGPEDVDGAKKREILFDWRMRTQVKFFKPLNYGIDQVLGSNGMTVFRVIWKFETRDYTVQFDLDELDPEVVDALYDVRMTDEDLFNIIAEENGVDLEFDENVDEINKAVEAFRDGKSKFELNLVEVAEDRPEITALNVKEDLVVPYDTKDINSARFIDYKNLWMTKNDLKIAMDVGKYEKFSDSDLESWAGKQSAEDKKVHGVQEVFKDDLVRLHETCCWYDVNGDGIKERCIVTWPDADPTSILRFIELPYDHAQWPYVQVKRELVDDNFYSTRGIPSLDEDTQIGASTALNQAVDNGTLLNMPERVARKGVISNPRSRRFIPGEFTEVNGSPGEYETRQYVNGSQPVLFQQIQFLKSFSNDRLGNQTTGFGQTSLPGLGDQGKKTAREIDAQAMQQGMATSLDLQVFQQQMADVYYQIDALYNQFGSAEETIQITNQPPVEISRDEIQGKFNIVPNGRVDNSTPQARLQKLIFAFNIAGQSPLIKQKELLEMILKELDPRIAGNVFKTDEELAQEQQAQAAGAAQAEQDQIRKQLGLRKLSDDMDIRKEALLTPVQGRKYAPN